MLLMFILLDIHSDNYSLFSVYLHVLKHLTVRPVGPERKLLGCLVFL